MWDGRVQVGMIKLSGRSTLATFSTMIICQEEMLEHAGRKREDSWGKALINAAHSEKFKAPPREY